MHPFPNFMSILCDKYFTEIDILPHGNDEAKHVVNLTSTLSHHLDYTFLCDSHEPLKQRSTEQHTCGILNCKLWQASNVNSSAHQQCTLNTMCACDILPFYLHPFPLFSHHHPVPSLSYLWNANPYQQVPEKVWSEVLTRNFDNMSADCQYATDFICCVSEESTN